MTAKCLETVKKSCTKFFCKIPSQYEKKHTKQIPSGHIVKYFIQHLNKLSRDLLPQSFDSNMLTVLAVACFSKRITCFFTNDHMFFTNDHMFFTSDHMFFKKDHMFFTNDHMFLTNDHIIFTNDYMLLTYSRNRPPKSLPICDRLW